MAADSHPPATTQPVSTLTTEVGRGAVVQSFYASRNMKIFPVAEHEVDALTMMNTLNTVLLTVGVGLWSLAAGIWITDMFTAENTPAGIVLAKFATWLLIALGVICFALCCWSWSRRKSTWQRIVDESGGQ